MVTTEAQKRASCNYRQKKMKGNVAARYYTPIKLHKALDRFAKETGSTKEELINQFVIAGLKAKGVNIKF